MGPCKALIYEVVDHVMVRDQHILKKHMAIDVGWGHLGSPPQLVREGIYVMRDEALDTFDRCCSISFE